MVQQSPHEVMLEGLAEEMSLQFTAVGIMKSSVYCRQSPSAACLSSSRSVDPVLHRARQLF